MFIRTPAENSPIRCTRETAPPSRGHLSDLYIPQNRNFEQMCTEPDMIVIQTYKIFRGRGHWRRSAAPSGFHVRIGNSFWNKFNVEEVVRGVRSMMHGRIGNLELAKT